MQVRPNKQGMEPWRHLYLSQPATARLRTLLPTPPAQQSARPRSSTMSVGVPDAVLGFFQILVRQLSREETIEVIETKGAMVSSETIWNEVQVARTAGWVFHPILKLRLCAHAIIAWLCNVFFFFFFDYAEVRSTDAILVCSSNKDHILNGTL